MKRICIFIISFLFVFSCYAQKKIGTVENDGVLEIFYCNNDIVYTYVEEKEGLISILQDFYCVVNGKKYGPFTKQPYIKKTDKNYYIEIQVDKSFGYIIDNTIYGPYEDLDDISFNTDESSYCFIYSDAENKYYLIQDGKVIDEKPFILEAEFSPTNVLCYSYGDFDEKGIPVGYVKVGENIYGPYDDLDDFEFADNGDYYIGVDLGDEDYYVLCNGKLYLEDDFEENYDDFGFSHLKNDSEGVYYTDGIKRSPSFDKIDSEDIKTIDDILIFTAIKDDQYYIVKNITEIYGPYPKISSYYIYLEPITKRLYYNVEDNETWYLYRENTKITSSLYSIYPYFSENGKICAYITKTGDKKYMLEVGNEKIGPYNNIFSVSISADGSKIIYGADIDGYEYAFEGVKKYGPFRDVRDISLSPDDSIAFTFENNDYDSFIYYKGKTYGPYDKVNNGFFSDFAFSPDGKHIAGYIGYYGVDSKYLFIDGEIKGEIKEGNIIQPDFSKDGNHILCLTYDPESVYLDGNKLNGRNGGTLSFIDYGIVSYIESKDNKTIDHLIIDGKDYKGQFLSNDFIYIDGKDIILIEN